MSRKVLFLVLAAGLTFCPLARGDFKYTETTQITGGVMASMMKGLGIFSKSMRQATKPMESTTYVKGNYLRTDNADGTYRIIDLNGKRIMEVKPNAHAYSVMTFEQMRQMMQQMQQAMREATQKQSSAQNTSVTMTPKIEVSPTGKTQNILGKDTREIVVKMDLEIQATDTQHGTRSGTISTEVDSWVAPSVVGYHEVSDFYKKMAVEIGWTPNATLGMDPRMTQSMAELYKSGKIPAGLPLLTTFSMLGAPQSGGQASTQPQEQQPSSSAADVTSPGAAAAKALGGLFGHRHQKKQEEDEQNASGPQASTPSNSLMSVSTRVESFSTDPVDASLFQIPSGFTEVPSDLERRMQGNSH